MWRPIICLLLVLLKGTMQGQYITIQGDQFIDEHGEPFYPMIMSYYVDYYYVTGSVPSLTPTAAQAQALYYGRTSAQGDAGEFGHSPASAGPASILKDLAELKAQGWNTIRFLSNAPKNVGSDGYKIRVKHYPSGQDGLELNMVPPYVDDVNLNPMCWFHFNTILAVCSLANILDMKVLIEPAMSPALVMDNTGTDHVNFLSSLAAFIEEHNVANLLGYEFYGEPTYADWTEKPDHTKAEICQIVHEWNEAIKANDPNHLTTVGGCLIDDPSRQGWDPLLLEADFASMHIYPGPSIYEFNADYSTFLEKAYERYQGQLYIYDHYLKKPYVIDETGFQGEDPIGENGLPNSWISYPWGAAGDEQDQDDFLQATWPMIRDSRCAGYGWWLMQNTHYVGEPNAQQHDLSPLRDYAARYFGLLRYGDPSNIPNTTGYETYRKKAAQTLVDWTTNPPPYTPLYDPPSSVDMNHRFYNPFMHPTNGVLYPDALNPTNYGTLMGHVEDQFGDPIPGAIVKGASYSSPGNLYGYWTYTDDNGDFELRGYDPEPSIPLDPINDLGQFTDRMIHNMAISAYGTEWHEVGWIGGTFEDGATYELNSLQSVYTSFLDNIEVGIGQSEAYRGLSTLTAEDVHVLGSAELKARYEVHLLPGFHAEVDGECHVFTEPVMLTCSEVSAADLRSSTNSTIMPPRVRSNSPERSFDLVFLQPSVSPRLEVAPNPAENEVFIRLMDLAPADLGVHEVTIVDDRGRLILKTSFSGIAYVLDLKDLAPSTYTISVATDSEFLQQQLIKR